MAAIDNLPAFDDEGLTHVVIETPRGSRNKYKYSPKTLFFECDKSLTAGLTFPFDFGFIPSTSAADGDPLDAMVLMDQPTFPGCLVHTKVLGIMEAEQSKKGRIYRNDRVLTVHNFSVEYGDLNSWQEITPTFINELEAFFVFQNQSKGEQFKVLDWKGPTDAQLTIKRTVV